MLKTTQKLKRFMTCCSAHHALRNGGEVFSAPVCSDMNNGAL